MADIALTAAKISLVFDPNMAGTIVRSYIAGVAISAGQTIYVTSAGVAGVCDANDSGKEQFRGIALETVGAGQAVDVCQEGLLEGFTIAGLAYDALVYQGDTAGALADAASSTKTVKAGRVTPMPTRDSAGAVKKVLHVKADMINNW